MEASAPRLASRPDHISRLTMSLSVICRWSLSARPVGMRFESLDDGVDDEALSALIVVLALLEQPEDPPREDLLDGAVEGHCGELGGDRVAERAVHLGRRDDVSDPVIRLADLRQVGLAER